MPKLLHTMLRVFNLERSVAFYRDHLGMTELRRNEVTAGRYSLVFMGYAPSDGSNEIELTYNWDQTEPYILGTAFGHLAVGVPDVAATVDAMRAGGARVTREPGPVKHGTTVIAFVEDPDGYKIELIERK
jgi:lactoylglutathione lyase